MRPELLEDRRRRVARELAERIDVLYKLMNAERPDTMRRRIYAVEFVRLKMIQDVRDRL